jgi:hypothetical protein
MKVEYELWRILNRLYHLEGSPAPKNITLAKTCSSSNSLNWIAWTIDGMLVDIPAKKSQLIENVKKLVHANYLEVANNIHYACDYYYLTELGREAARDIQYELF